MLISISSFTGTTVVASELSAEATSTPYPVVETAPEATAEQPLPGIESLTRHVTMMKAAEIKAERLRENAAAIDRAVAKTKKYVGKTWYVFAGSTPSGWDCSGLVRWTYKNIGVELPHSASAQVRVGKRVNSPLPGDIVGWTFGGSTFYHVGIYLGDNRVMHSPNRGLRTTIMDVNTPGWGSASYYRIIPRDDSTPSERKADLADQLLAESK
jgi:cell wall-associated NlpC family hydrolase